MSAGLVRVVGKVQTMGGEENVVEFDRYVFRDKQIKKVTLRIEPDVYGGMPGRYELRADGTPDYASSINRYYDSPEAVVRALTADLEQRKLSLQTQLRAVNKELKALVKGIV